MEINTRCFEAINTACLDITVSFLCSDKLWIECFSLWSSDIKSHLFISIPNHRFSKRTTCMCLSTFHKLTLCIFFCHYNFQGSLHCRGNIKSSTTQRLMAVSLTLYRPLYWLHYQYNVTFIKSLVYYSLMYSDCEDWVIHCILL